MNTYWMSEGTLTISVLDWGEWSASSPVRFTAGGRASGTLWIDDWVSPRFGLTRWRREDKNPYLCWELNTVHPARSLVIILTEERHYFHVFRTFCLLYSTLGMANRRPEGTLEGFLGDCKNSKIFIIIFNCCWVTAGAGNFFLHLVQPPIQWVPGALSLRVERPGCEADHSPPPSAEVKNAWSSTSTPPIHLYGMVLSWSTEITLPVPFTWWQQTTWCSGSSTVWTDSVQCQEFR
jgi:hypothetical protein